MFHLRSTQAISYTEYVIALLTLLQRGDQKVSLPTTVAVAVGWLSVAVNVGLAFLRYESWFFFVTYLSYVKVASTFLKYIPQVQASLVRYQVC